MAESDFENDLQLWGDDLDSNQHDNNNITSPENFENREDSDVHGTQFADDIFLPGEDYEHDPTPSLTQNSTQGTDDNVPPPLCPTYCYDEYPPPIEEASDPRFLSQEGNSQQYDSWHTDSNVQSVLPEFSGRYDDSTIARQLDDLVDPHALHKLCKDRGDPWNPYRAKRSTRPETNEAIEQLNSSSKPSIPHDGNNEQILKDSSNRKIYSDEGAPQREDTAVLQRGGSRPCCWRCRILKEGCTGGPECHRCSSVKRARFFVLPCSTPRIVELMKVLIPERLLAWLEAIVKSLPEEEQKGEADLAEERETFYVKLTAEIGPSLILPIVRVKSRADPAGPHTSSDKPKRTAIHYLNDDIGRITTIWNEWLEEVANSQLNQLCNLAFRGSHDWVLKALDVVCDFCMNVSVGSLLRPLSVVGCDMSNPDIMLHCSVKLFFAIYLVSSPLEVGGGGIENEDEQTEVKNQFRSMARGVLEPLISQISKDLDDLVWNKRARHIGHILATLVFLSLSSHFNQFMRIRLPDVAANESSTNSDIDDMNRDVHSINELIYCTFRKPITAIINKPNENPNPPVRNTEQVWEIWPDNSRLICGLWAIVRDVNGTEAGNELRRNVRVYDTTSGTSIQGVSRVIFDAIAPLIGKELQPLFRRKKGTHS